MYLSSFETVTRQSAIDAIALYQKYISPKKGFSCSHRRLHGGTSCSQYAKNLLSEQNLELAVKMSVQRFRDCAKASRALRNQKAEGGCLIIPCCIPF
jgi:putative component of membrane protein insertase Oxa1/YidC/SpoIIIJ protein YidD